MSIKLIDKLNKDYDSYVLSDNDKNRIKPILKELTIHNLSFKYFLTIPYYYRQDNWEQVVEDNRKLKSVIRTNYKSNIRMLFFIEKHLSEGEKHYGGYHRHILIEEPAPEDWNNPPSSLDKIMNEIVPEAYFAINFDGEPTEEQKIKLLKRVSRFCKSVPNSNKGFDVRNTFNIEKLIGYCTKQIKNTEQTYDVIDEKNSDIDELFAANKDTKTNGILNLLYFPIDKVSVGNKNKDCSIIK